MSYVRLSEGGFQVLYLLGSMRTVQSQGLSRCSHDMASKRQINIVSTKVYTRQTYAICSPQSVQYTVLLTAHAANLFIYLLLIDVAYPKRPTQIRLDGDTIEHGHQPDGRGLTASCGV